MQLSTVINNYLLRKKGDRSIFSAPFDVKPSDTPLIIVQPDIMVICDKDQLDENRCNGAPDFIIEIVFLGNLSDDYIRKAYYYKNYGVREDIDNNMLHQGICKIRKGNAMPFRAIHDHCE